MKLNYKDAAHILEEEVEQSNSIETTGFWVEITTELAQQCQDKNRTMIAMLGTALLAKATNIKVDPFSLQVGKNKEGITYSARALCKDVLAANSKRLGIDLGVTGREPLNNQPFFGKQRITPDFKVRSDAQKALDVLLRALSALEKLTTNKQARLALRAFLQVQKRRKPQINVSLDDGDQLDIPDLITKITSFVSENSEGGKRAQAVSAGLLDVLYGKERVDAKRINDPGRRMPGDIGILCFSAEGFERIFEVKDKPITNKDIQILLDTIVESPIAIISMIAVASDQQEIDIESANRWGEARKKRFRLFLGWKELVSECLFWSSYKSVVVGHAYRSILERLQSYEISTEGLNSWRIK